MISIKNTNIILEVESHDLWLIGISVKEKILNNAKTYMSKCINSDSEASFLNYVHKMNLPLFRYLEVIFMHLNRPDIFESIDNDLHDIFCDMKYSKEQD